MYVNPALANAQICTCSQLYVKQEGEPPIWLGFISLCDYSGVCLFVFIISQISFPLVTNASSMI